MALSLDDLKMSDEELGIRLISICIAMEAENRGIALDEIGVDFAGWVVGELTGLETGKVELVALEKAIHKAAAGDVKAGGRLLREHVVNGAVDLAIFNNLVAEVARKLKGPKAGGAKTATIRQEDAKSRNEAILAAEEQLLAEGHEPRSIATKLAERFSLSAKQIRRIIKKK